MKLNMLFLTILLMYLINIEPIYSLWNYNEFDMEGFKDSAEVPAPPNSLSSGTLQSHRYSFYDAGKNRTFVISAPYGYAILATLQFLDLRPYKQDTLTLFDNEQRSLKALILNNSKTYGLKETFEDENRYTFYAPSGKLGVTFTTGSSWSSIGYDGFKLIYTVQGKHLGDCGFSAYWCDNDNCIYGGFKCDGHNNCGDRSDEEYCWFISSSNPTARPTYPTARSTYPTTRPTYPTARSTYPTARPTYTTDRWTYPTTRPIYPTFRPIIPTFRPIYPTIDDNDGPGRVIGISCGVFFVAIAIGCGIFIVARRTNVPRTEIRTVHPPPRPGNSYYPDTPPPPYSVCQGINNPAFP